MNCKIQAKMSRIKEKIKLLLILFFSIICINFEQIANFNNTCQKFMLIIPKNRTYSKKIPVTLIDNTFIKFTSMLFISATSIKDNTLQEEIAHECKEVKKEK